MSKKKGIAQLRRRGGLQEKIRKVGGTTPRQYLSASKDRSEDGVPVGEYKIGQLIGTKQFLSPSRHVRTGRWCWGGTAVELNQLIEKMKLRYEDGPKKGEIISIDHSPAEDRLTNPQDPVFNHSSFYNTHYIENDRVDFDQDNPRHRFMWLCQIGTPGTIDRSEQKRISKYERGNIRLEAVAPKQEAMSKKERVKNVARATALLEHLEKDQDRMHMVALAMTLPTYSPKHAPDQVYMAIWSEVIEGNQKPRSKYNNRTIQSRFIELAEMDAEELSIAANVMLAKNKQIIVRRKTGYLLNGNMIPDIKTDYHLTKYFLDPENQDEYVELADTLGEDAV